MIQRPLVHYSVVIEAFVTNMHWAKMRRKGMNRIDHPRQEGCVLAA